VSDGCGKSGGYHSLISDTLSIDYTLQFLNDGLLGRLLISASPQGKQD
jgi:hypothetical protein